MTELFIKNRQGQKLSVLVEQAKNQVGLAFVMHGLGGFKEQPHLQTFTQAFRDNNYTVICFDAGDTIGQSQPGNCENASITNYYQDLEDIIKWARKQSWYQEPFCLAGHSLGGTVTALFAQKFPSKVKALAPISTVVSGVLSLVMHTKKELKEWEKTGWHEEISHSKPGVLKRYKWMQIQDRLKYDLLIKVNTLIMPVLMIVGSQDNSTPSKHQQILYKQLPGKKEFHIIQGAPHTFRDKKHLDEIYKIFNKWIKNL